MPEQTEVQEVVHVKLFDHYNTEMCHYDIGAPRGLRAAAKFAQQLGHHCVVISKENNGALNCRGLFAQIHSAMGKGSACHVVSDGCRRNLVVDDGLLALQSQWPHTVDVQEARAFEDSWSVKRCEVQYKDVANGTWNHNLDFESDMHYGLVVQRIMYDICGFKDKQLLYTSGRPTFLQTEEYFAPAVANNELLWTIAPGSEVRHLAHVAADAEARAEHELRKAAKDQVHADKLQAKSRKEVGNAVEDLVVAEDARAGGIAIVDACGARVPPSTAATVLAVAAAKDEATDAKRKRWLHIAIVAVLALLVVWLIFRIGRSLFASSAGERTRTRTQVLGPEDYM